MYQRTKGLGSLTPTWEEAIRRDIKYVLTDYDGVVAASLQPAKAEILSRFLDYAEQGATIVVCTAQFLGSAKEIGMRELFLKGISNAAINSGREHLLERFYCLPCYGTFKYQITAPFEITQVESASWDYDRWLGIVNTVADYSELELVHKVTLREVYTSIWCNDVNSRKLVYDRLCMDLAGSESFINIEFQDCPDVPQEIIKIRPAVVNKALGKKWLLEYFQPDPAHVLTAGDNYHAEGSNSHRDYLQAGDDTFLFIPGAVNLSVGKHHGMTGTVDMRGTFENGLLKFVRHNQEV